MAARRPPLSTAVARWHADETTVGSPLIASEVAYLRRTRVFGATGTVLMAIGALRAAHESGVHVPDDLSIVGFDDIELSAYTSPPLTTVAQPKERIGALAVDMLLERVGGKRRDARKVVLQPELRVRASTARHASFREAAAPAPAAAPSSTEKRKSRAP